MRFTIGNVSEHSNNVNLSINFTNVTLEEAASIIRTIESKTCANLSKMDKEIVNLIKAGSLLNAVKYHKDQTGMGLKESKEYCDRLKEMYCLA
jgi:ribosomal protein L7/L12